MRTLLNSNQPHFAPANGDGADGGAGAGNPTGAAGFDQAAFSATILAEVNKALVGFGKTFKADLAKLTAKPAAVTATPDPDPAIDAATDPAAASDKVKQDPAVAAQLRAMERRLKESDDRFAAMKTESDTTKRNADKKELDATVRTKLNKFKFQDESAAQDAFEIFGSKIKRDEDGNFVGSDGTPMDQYLEEGMRAKPYLLAAKDVGGEKRWKLFGTSAPGRYLVVVFTIRHLRLRPVTAHTMNQRERRIYAPEIDKTP